MEQQLVPAPPSPAVVIWEGDPEQQLDYAHKASIVLMKRVNAKKRKIVINGREYLEIGDWQTVGHFFGCSVGTDWSRPIVRDGLIAGYEAKATVYRHGVLVSSAEAMCMTAEKRWKDAQEYALRSMAQTRAASKALRNAVGWVVELAGYSSTPAEEMDDDENPAPTRSKPAPQPIEHIDPETGEITEASPPPDKPPPVELITNEEAENINKLLEASATPLELFLQLGKVSSVVMLPRNKYPNAVYWLENRIPKGKRS